MTQRSQIVWTMGLLVLVGFLWAIYAPNCLGSSFAYPTIFGAAVVGHLAGREAEGVDPGINDITSLLIAVFLYGWVGVIFAGLSVGLGWFLGVLVCVNLLPEFGDFRCIVCLQATRS